MWIYLSFIVSDIEVLYELLSLGSSAGRTFNSRQVREISHPGVQEMSVMSILEKTERK